RESPAHEIIVVTEAGMLHRLGKEIPAKTFIPGPTNNCFCGECRYMKMNTLEKAYDALLNMEPEITLPPWRLSSLAATFNLVTGPSSHITSARCKGRRFSSSSSFCCSAFCFYANRDFSVLKRFFCAGY